MTRDDTYKLILYLIIIFLSWFIVREIYGQDKLKPVSLLQDTANLKNYPVGSSKIVPGGIIYKANDSTYKYNTGLSHAIYRDGDTLQLGKFIPKTDLVSGGYTQSITENQKLSITPKGKFRIISEKDTMVLEPEGGAVSAKSFRQLPSGWEFNFATDTISVFMDAEGVKTISKLWTRSKIGFTARFSGGIDLSKDRISRWYLQPATAHDDTGKIIPITQTVAWLDTAIWITQSFDSKIAKFPVTIDPNLNISDTSLVMDTRVDQANATTNYGATDPLEIYNYGSNNYRILVRFNTSSLPSAISVSAFSCSLNCIQIVAGSADGFTLYDLDASWIEKGTNSVTWNTQPAKRDSANCTVSHSGTGWKNFTATGVHGWIESWASGATANNGILIKFELENRPWDATRAYYKYTAKENGTPGNRAKFEVVYTESGGSPAAAPLADKLGRPWGKPGYYGLGKELKKRRNTGTIGNEVYRKP